MAGLAIDFGGSAVKLGILDAGTIVETAQLTVTGDASDLDRAARTATDLIRRSSGTAVTGAGLALPGVVDRDAGRLVRAHGKYGYLGDRDLRVWARQTIGLPAVIENDGRAALLGELSYGCAVGARDAVIVTLGTGIGSAAIIDGVLLRGRHDHAGILGGHSTVELDGPICNCGNRGCAEAVASTWALRDRYPGGLRDLFDTAPEQIDEPTRSDRDRVLQVWGAAIVNLCHAYDPEVVIVTGAVLRSVDRVLPALTHYVHQRLWSSSHRPPLISPERPEWSVLRGLGALADRIEQADHLQQPDQTRTVRA
ncbi:ROK family protein [Microlunatus soli]|uniref:Glucokinase n=1 Tax=Microlunatus soli TaxID=630515 RepID=A0A1H1WUH3_9ACTN|nr:ROK family protein [Microlunatus soli]SDT00774.1 glucokinase [Microlunatus soli]